MKDAPALENATRLNGQVHILVEKRTYKPAGWKHLRDFTVPCRVTKKRIYTAGQLPRHVFNRDTGEEILDVESRVNASYRYTAQSTMVIA